MDDEAPCGCCDLRPYAAANPMRFSTKYWDDETGLGYWGYRYYSPALGRWISRDPLGEQGRGLLQRAAGRARGATLEIIAQARVTQAALLPRRGSSSQGQFALYNYAANDPYAYVDALGLSHCGPCAPGETCCSQWTPMWQMLGKTSAGNCTADLFLDMLPDWVSALILSSLQGLTAGAVVEASGASGLLSVISGVLATAGIASFDAMVMLGIAADTCTDNVCTRDRPPDTLCSFWCFSGERCTCLNADGTEDGFAVVGTVRDE